MAEIRTNITLAPYTSFNCGGPAEKLVVINSSTELLDFLRTNTTEPPVWTLGYGTNCLISDHGLPGLTIVLNKGQITQQDNLIIADAGVWWDDIVALTVENGLWGMELMSGIPGSVGAAVAGNIAAYGQSVDQTLAWIEVLDLKNNQTKVFKAADLKLDYRSSLFQTKPFQNYIITKAAFQLSNVQQNVLSYPSALRSAEELGLTLDSLQNCRQIIMHARSSIGSLFNPGDRANHRSAGSFFKNPLVSSEVAASLAKFDEKASPNDALKQNAIHGGNAKRVSAALVLLAAGYKRGQSWGDVRLHPDHVLKLENTGKATAQQIYNVAQEIIHTVKNSLGVDLETEVRFLGKFDQ